MLIMCEICVPNTILFKLVKFNLNQTQYVWAGSKITYKYVRFKTTMVSAW